MPHSSVQRHCTARQPVIHPETHAFADDGTIPNSPLPLLLHRAALPADPAAIERAFAGNGWANSWRNGIFPFHHFHSNAHEVLGIAAGRARVRFGGAQGRDVEVAAGDVVVIPAGVGHCRVSDDAGLLVVGAYPGGAEYDTCRGDPAQAQAVRRNIARVPLPAADPLFGADGPLRALW
ncbi:MAG: cupin domain-containing protein, partial [Acidisphaera sp.]|nr:cupin domain-containing protein [Acidisphaera sp.]